MTSSVPDHPRRLNCSRRPTLSERMPFIFHRPTQRDTASAGAIARRKTVIGLKDASKSRCVVETKEFIVILR